MARAAIAQIHCHPTAVRPLESALRPSKNESPRRSTPARCECQSHACSVRHDSRFPQTARADQFCEGWAEGAYQAIEPFIVTDTEKTLMANFLAKMKKEQNLSDLKPREAKKCRGDQDAAEAGFNEGLKARLNHGVSGKDSALSLEYKS